MSNFPPPPPPPSPGSPGWGQPNPQQWMPPGQPQWTPGQPQWPGQVYPGAPGSAGFWARFGAWFIDGLILSPFAIIGQIVLATGETELEACGFDSSLMCENPTSGTYALYALITIAGFVAGILYYGLMEGRSGQTIGKHALGIRVVDASTGMPIGVGRGIGRYFARILSALVCALGYLWMLWDPNKQTWHDKMVRSYVVRS